MSVPHERLLLQKSATVNRDLGFGEVCKEKHAIVAYNNDHEFFEILKGEMVTSGWTYGVQPFVKYGRPVAWEWEIQAAFFKSNNITPHWIYCNYDWGTLNETTGQWSGAVGQIQRDEADYAIFGFAGTHPRSKVAAFSPGTNYIPYHWLTRYPQELTPMWNLLGLFTEVYKNRVV